MAVSKKRQSISESISVSLGLQDPRHLNDNSNSQFTTNSYSTVNNSNSNQNNYLGRSYVSSFLSPKGSVRKNSGSLPINNAQLHLSRHIHESNRINRQTAAISENLSNGQNDDIDNFINIVENNEIRTANIDNDDNIGSLDDFVFNNAIDTGNTYVNENSRLLTPLSSRSIAISITDVDNNDLSHDDHFLSPYTSLPESVKPYGSIGTTSSMGDSQIRVTNGQKIQNFLYDILNYLPASILGLLLNILDALSYGMIIFPITEPLFSHLGPTGISMFYISTIICQFIFSSGWSNFPNSIGSEMIEVTPFFHTMALAIMDTLGEDRPNEVITTTIFCYIISSMITGLTFLALGKLKLGKIVGFFPRHILIGCIGGVGYFLLITGIEVCTRIAKFKYSLPFLLNLFTDFEMLGKWLLPVILTIILIFTQSHFKNSLVLPSFYILTLVLFHFVVAIVPSLSLTQLRDSGWIFPMADDSSNWYEHYKYFNFYNVHWGLVIKQIPTMLALTFFGILHVPINVPALAMSVQMDKYDIDKELIAHGWSNLVSGMLGSIQNYLVYTNSVLFIRAGADSAMAGYLLMVLTAIIMFIGPIIISFIPICIVGSLIFLLGYELIIEALWDTLGKLNTFEYLTVVIIVFTMGIFDFVLGIIVGILIACFKFLIDSSKLQTINGEFNGHVAKSTVYRDPIQTKFLNAIGEQIYVLKLQNLLFFGTIISIEEKIDKLLEISENDSSKRRIKYLILDFKNINTDNIDYSAAEGFNRIKRFTQTKRIQLIISSIRERDHIYNAFNNVGLLDDVELFNDLNSALEWCENEFLTKYTEFREKAKAKKFKAINNNPTNKNNLHAQNPNRVSQVLSSVPINTPRNNQMVSVAQNIFKNEEENAKSLREQLHNEQPVLPLLLLALKPYRPTIASTDKIQRDQEIDLWNQLCPFFKQEAITSDTLIVHSSNIFFIVETGVLKASFQLPQGTVYETMSNRTCYGKIIENDSDLTTSLTIKTETDSVLWIIESDILNTIRIEKPQLYIELVLLIMVIKDRRFKDLLGHALVSA